MTTTEPNHPPHAINPTTDGRIRVHSPADLIDTVPYLLGFHPDESLVVVGLDGPGEECAVRVVLRVDLDEAVLGEQFVDDELGGDDDGAGPFDDLAGTLQRAEVDCVIAIVFTGRAGPEPATVPGWLGLAAGLTHVLGDHGVETVDVLLADDDHWWSLTCEDPQHCEAAGGDRAATPSRVAVEATVAGLVALPSRDSVVANLSGASARERDQLRPALAAAERRLNADGDAQRSQRLRESDLRALRGLVRRQAGRPMSPPMSDRVLARLGVALSRIQLRDAVWLDLDAGNIEADGLLFELFTRLPAPYDAPAAFLYGWSRWRAGDGTVAALCAELALASDPTYSAARLLLTTVRSGADPHRFPPLTDPD